ncbi:hypothetical protein CORC01_00795 [Colletotrichum orchidophilum]|uniref:Uncharacterized protein n=1 Tax=Colletotrichum orchidophilum TaxID=1209926 RepID=A0A1G4BRD5_9PEZI|nr:uncharacterized protein CORC01_00795 [Colletotrichum orchidophilum]OHF03933.1 hypothetical protein CORC01_00795 [Colletotrichum orchidophilum]
MALPSLVFFLCSLFAAFVEAVNRFRRPPGPGLASDYRDNNVYTTGDNLDLHWDMDYDSARLILWQQLTVDGASMDYIDIASKEPANWAVTCHYFNITEAPAAPQPGNTTVALPPPTSEDKGLPAGAAAGIAVGVTFAAVFGIGAIAWLLWRRQRARRAPTLADNDIKASRDGSQGQGYQYALSTQWQPELPAEGHGLYEIHATSMDVRYEMSSNQGQAGVRGDSLRLLSDTR